MTDPRVVVQISEGGWARHGTVLAEDHPDVSWLVVGADSLHLDGAEISRDEARPNVVWFGYDVLRTDAVRQHFGLARRAASLQLAITSYAGLDGDIWSEFAARGVAVTHGHLSGPRISQFIMARVLEWYHQPSRLAESRSERDWTAQEYTEIEGSTWAVVGLGAIGNNVARRAKAFGANVIGVRRTVDGTELTDEATTFADIDRVASRADVIVFAVPDSATTRELVDARFLAQMKETAVLVNVGRGTLILEEDLIEALDAGRPAVAILDVVREEPLPNEHPLWFHPKVMLSPHTSAAGSNRHTRSRELFSANLRRFIAGEPLPDLFGG